MGEMISRRLPPWEWLTKAFLVTWPLALSFQIWLVNKIHAHDVALSELNLIVAQSARTSESDSEKLRLKIISEVGEKTALRYAEIAAKLEALQLAMIRLEERGKLTGTMQLPSTTPVPWLTNANIPGLGGYFVPNVQGVPK